MTRFQKVALIALLSLAFTFAGCKSDSPAAPSNPTSPVACSTASTVGSCVYSVSGFCVDYTGIGFTNGAAAGNCVAAENTYTSGAPCSTTGAVGACIFNMGAVSERIQQYYAPYTADTMKTACSAAGGRLCL